MVGMRLSVGVACALWLGGCIGLKSTLQADGGSGMGGDSAAGMGGSGGGGGSGMSGSGAVGGSGGLGTSGSGAIGGSGGLGTSGSGAIGGGGSGGIGGIGGIGGVGGTGGGSVGGGNACSGSVYTRPVDLLIVVDNSGSMREEQAALRAQMPTLMHSLSVGSLGDGTTFAPVTDLRVGVISTDMGVPDVPLREQLGCRDEMSRFGDDGILRTAGNPSGDPALSCAPSYPPFITYERQNADPGANEAAALALASDVQCVATLGTQGCGFEMQLEAMLRSLWPSDNGGEAFTDGRTFRDGTMSGHGGPHGINAGFLRPNSLLAIVVLTDEEDCSSHTNSHFVPRDLLPPNDPQRDIGLNLRCHNEATRLGPNGEALRDDGQANLFATRRYADALRALRPGRPDLVLFNVIAGYPADLVNAQALSQVNFGNASERDAFYDGLLQDPRMVEAVDENSLTGNPNLIPSCLREGDFDPNGGGPIVQKAFPPRRLTKVAKALGESALVQSICQDDFSSVADTILRRVTSTITSECPLL